MTPATFWYWTLDPPKKWQLGSVGAARTPIYAGCADCDADEPEIAGILSTDGTYQGIALYGRITDERMIRPAMFCASCYAKRLEKGKEAQTATT